MNLLNRFKSDVGIIIIVSTWYCTNHNHLPK
jgi:hypothetical protein